MSISFKNKKGLPTFEQTDFLQKNLFLELRKPSLYLCERKFLNFLHQAFSAPLEEGLKASLSPLPNSLKQTRSIEMNAAGKNTQCGELAKASCAELSIVPTEVIVSVCKFTIPR